MLTWAELEAAMRARELLTEEEYRALQGAPPAGACDCCTCNAIRNHSECCEAIECEPCDPRVMCQHCGSCMCSVDDEGDPWT